MNTFRVLKTAVTDVAATTTQPGATTAARTGVLNLSKGFTVQTPNFLAPTSRGVVPHISPDNFERNTGVEGVFVALEDFIEKAPQRIPPLYTYPSTLRSFISLPSSAFLLLSARRSPNITCPKANSDANLSILTSVGFRDLPIKDYVSAVIRLEPDIVLGIADIANTVSPGKNRVQKMVNRTVKWLDELLGSVYAGGSSSGGGDNNSTDEKDTVKKLPAVFAPILPLEKERQRFYLSHLVENVEKLSGLVFTTNESVDVVPEELAGLPKLQSDVVGGPHQVLEMVERGVDLFNVGFVGTMTDAGIALHFSFSADEVMDNGGKDKLDLATDMWDVKFATDLSPLEEGCDCYTCKTHHKAYIRHCLEAKEMTAWVLLQIHNLKVVERFFGGVRRSIEEGWWEKGRSGFEVKYTREMPVGTGLGPRLRGYQYKSVGGEGKLNEPAYRSLDSGDEDGL
ncbi:hypothetical protein AOL_s00007g452 [Orbilia oligospora ATCC 24927]|uniref:Queuine tRNA-ribosyltransferase accessory subunit 2 n=1 Tax=Arthrobotrys oligospora (strain ATCC 24927 / CBS 115.81 / DSM 1491) TaxID=756982 RepID=G1X2E3_ARTOA|nr:hypothetical protein AOL_s00007g452 [Orbilia oligospora ATCC 24927]EGX52669.1 hypothetical protein AOL_s00007g452 [Orbilia oligospora ATCC 24927]